MATVTEVLECMSARGVELTLARLYDPAGKEAERWEVYQNGNLLDRFMNEPDSAAKASARFAERERDLRQGKPFWPGYVFPQPDQPEVRHTPVRGDLRLIWAGIEEKGFAAASVKPGEAAAIILTYSKVPKGLKAVWFIGDGKSHEALIMANEGLHTHQAKLLAERDWFEAQGKGERFGSVPPDVSRHGFSWVHPPDSLGGLYDGKWRDMDREWAKSILKMFREGQTELGHSAIDGCGAISMKCPHGYPSYVEVAERFLDQWKSQVDLIPDTKSDMEKAAKDARLKSLEALAAEAQELKLGYEPKVEDFPFLVVSRPGVTPMKVGQGRTMEEAMRDYEKPDYPLALRAAVADRCPLCGGSVVYRGLSHVECDGAGCRNHRG